MDPTYGRAKAGRPPHKATAIRPPTTHHENYQIRRTRHAGHCWRSKDELISDVLLWTPSREHAKAKRLARTFKLQLCVDMGCIPEDLPEGMNDWEKWRERVRDICTDGMTRWWWDDEINDIGVTIYYKISLYVWIYQMYFFSIETKLYFSKTEINNEENFSFFF